MSGLASPSGPAALGLGVATSGGTPRILKWLVGLGVLLAVYRFAPELATTTLVLIGIYLAATHAGELGTLVSSTTDVAGLFGLASTNPPTPAPPRTGPPARV